MRYSVDRVDKLVLTVSAAVRAGLAAVAILLMTGIVLAQSCPLSSPLVLKDTQDGFAGPTGMVVTIEPNCNFTVAQQIGPKLGEPYAKGRLTLEQQNRLMELLTRTAIGDMPEKLSIGGPPVNARRISVVFGGKISELTLPPGGGDLKTLRAVKGLPGG
jgi:hypothetical protein